MMTRRKFLGLSALALPATLGADLWTERTNLREFDISVDLLDHGYRTMAERGPLKGVAEQFMYFETGQGSEFTYGTHNGIDMTTTEAPANAACAACRPDPVPTSSINFPRRSSGRWGRR